MGAMKDPEAFEVRRRLFVQSDAAEIGVDVHSKSLCWNLHRGTSVPQRRIVRNRNSNRAFAPQAIERQ
jgi:hypothetical protein